MTSFRVRPRFRVVVEGEPNSVQQRIKERLKDSPDGLVADMTRGHIVLKIPEAQQHYWSPQLSLNLLPHEDGTEISGLYGPGPNVWALFAFGYAATGILSLFVSITGFASLNLGRDAYELWALPVFAAIALGLYVLSQMGQKLGAEQTFMLHHFFEASVGEKVHIL